MAKSKNASILSIIITVLMVGILALGIYFAVDKANSKKTEDKHVMLYLDEEYTVGDKIIYALYGYSEDKFVEMTYSINNGEEVDIVGAKFGESEDHAQYEKGVSEYYFDTMGQMINTSSMTAGHYNIVFYGYDAQGERYEIASPFYFQLLEVVEDVA